MNEWKYDKLSFWGVVKNIAGGYNFYRVTFCIKNHRINTWSYQLLVWLISYVFWHLFLKTVKIVKQYYIFTQRLRVTWYKVLNKHYVSIHMCICIGGIHKPCGHYRGRGIYQMSILLHKPYLVKLSTKGGKVSKCPKICPHGLWMNPCNGRVARDICVTCYDYYTRYYYYVKNALASIVFFELPIPHGKLMAIPLMICTEKLRFVLKVSWKKHRHQL